MNKIKKTRFPLEEIMLKHIAQNDKKWSEEDLPEMNVLRKQATEYLLEKGFPNTKMEKWRSTDMQPVYEEPLTIYDEAIPYTKKVNEIFQCDVHGFNTKVISLLNGTYYSKENEKLTVSKEGVIIGSLAYAKKEYPAFFKQYYGKIAGEPSDGLKAANTALARDGAFVFIPDNVEVKDALQLIKIMNQPNLAVNIRNLIILGKNAKLTFLHCDDSINHHAGFINTINEVFVGENSSFELYKLQNLNDETALLNQTYIHQERNSNVKAMVISLNGGLIRNEISNDLKGQGAFSNINGLYLMDNQQHIDNQIYVKHSVPDCESNQLFKGVLDQESKAVFNGYIWVAPDAQKTNAFQRNNNILLSDNAFVETQPQLEIYADDVKCSHGATVGQLDDEALFYMRQRGISFSDARMLLMYAFADEVISQISMEGLRLNIEDMVKRRLRGELSICDRCVLHCSNPEQPVIFDIDMSKI